jgi:hypothetical protein
MGVSASWRSFRDRFVAMSLTRSKFSPPNRCGRAREHEAGHTAKKTEDSGWNLIQSDRIGPAPALIKIVAT